MNFNLKIKNLLANFIHFTGILKYSLRHINPQTILILMYHRVLDTLPFECKVQPGMYVLSKTLEEHLVFLKQYFTITDLATLSSLNSDNTKPFCAITFDDGWHDFYTHAFPILKKHNIPATVFLPTSYIGTYKWFWTDLLAILYLKNKININRNFRYFDQINYILNKNKNEINFEKLLTYLKNENNIDRLIRDNFEKHDNLKAYTKKPAFLTWKQVKHMYQSGLITFGSHTANHKILTLLNDNELRKELTESKRKLMIEKVADSDFIPFCYPNGNYDDNVKQLVANQGYQIAVTTRGGLNSPETDRFELKRIGMHEDVSFSSSMFGCRLLQIF